MDDELKTYVLYKLRYVTKSRYIEKQKHIHCNAMGRPALKRHFLNVENKIFMKIFSPCLLPLGKNWHLCRLLIVFFHFFSFRIKDERASY